MIRDRFAPPEDGHPPQRDGEVRPRLPPRPRRPAGGRARVRAPGVRRAAASRPRCWRSSRPRPRESVAVAERLGRAAPPLHRAAHAAARPLPARGAARGGARGGAGLRRGDPRPRAQQHLPRRHAAQELRRHPPRPGHLLRLRRARACSPTAASGSCRRARYARRSSPASRGSSSARTTCSRRSSCRFLGLEGELRDAFMDAHRELLSVEFWRAMQEEHRAGRVPDVVPYPAPRAASPNRQNPALWQRSLIA